MKNKLMAIIASLFAFTFVANAESFFDLSIKAQTNVWGIRSAGSTKEVKKAESKLNDENSYYYYSKDMAGFFNGNWGLTLDGLFNVGYGIKLGLGVTGSLATSFSSMSVTAYDPSGKEVLKEDSYTPNSAERAALIAKAKDIMLIPELVAKYTFVDFDPISLYAIAKGGWVLPLGIFGDVTYQNPEKGKEKVEKAEEVSREFMNIFYSAGIGMNWIGIAAELAWTGVYYSWNVVQKANVYTYDEGKTTVSGNNTKQSGIDDKRQEVFNNMGVTLVLGYDWELF